MKKRILFVDDEADILHGLRNSLRRQRGEWDMTFAPGGPAALNELARSPYDVIVEGFSLDSLQSDALSRARLARRFLSDGKQGDEAFTAALVHDIGTLVLATALPEMFGEVVSTSRASDRPMHVVEKERFGITHAEIGAYLQGIWGLPSSIVYAVAYHHNPSAAPAGDCDVLAALHVADVLVNDRRRAEGDRDVSLDLPFLDRAGCGSRLGTWRAMADEEFGRPN